MIWLVLSILASSGLFVTFKLFNRYRIDVLPAIVVNYCTCFLTGNILLRENHVLQMNTLHENWFLPATVMGFMFITAFYLMGSTTRHAGAAASSVASKMSVVIPALVAIVFFHEIFSWIQYTGILISLVSVYLMAPSNAEIDRKKGMKLLVLVFLTSGAVDTGLNLIRHYNSEADSFQLSTVIFGSAAVVGSILFFIRKAQHKFSKKELLGGLLLGIINFFSLVFMFNAMSHYHLNTAWFFAVNNIGVVAVSTVLAAVLFRERIHTRGYLGLLVAAVAILFMNFNAFF